MSVKVNISATRAHLTGGHEVLEVEGKNVGQCLEHIVARFPETRGWLYGKDGKLNLHIEIYVNMASSYPEELAKPVSDGDELHIVEQLAGG